MASLAWEGAWLLWDGRPWSDALTQARARAKAKAWGNFSGSKGTPGHDVAALYFDDGDTQASVATVLPMNPPGTSGRMIYDRFGAALRKTWEKLSADGGITPSEIAAANAAAKADAKTIEASGPEIPLAVLIIGVIAAAGLAAYIVYQGATFVARTLAVYEADREIMRLHEEAKRIENDHAAREKAAGHALAWDPYELSILKQLEGASERQTQTPQTEAPGNAGIVLFVLAVVAGAVYLLRGKRGV